MAITLVKRIFETGGRHSTTVRSYTQTWMVQTSSRSDDEFAVLSAPGLPVLGEQHQTDALVYVTDLDAQRDTQQPLIWRVTVEYATPESPDGDGGGEQGKTIEDFGYKEHHWEFLQYSYVVEEAFPVQDNGEPRTFLTAVVNSMGDKFDPPIEENRANLLLVYTRNEPFYDPLQALDYADVLNSDTFLGAPKMKALCYPITSSKRKRDPKTGQFFYTKEYRFEFSNKGFVRELLNQGYRAKDNNGVEFPIPNREPKNLDVQSSKVLGPTEDAQYMKYLTKELRPFSALNIVL